MVYGGRLLFTLYQLMTQLSPAMNRTSIARERQGFWDGILVPCFESISRDIRLSGRCLYERNERVWRPPLCGTQEALQHKEVP